MVLLGFCALTASAQDARELVKQGMALSQSGDYTGAVAKYKAALAMEPDNTTANYQLAFSLQASGKGAEALPYLQKVIQSDAPVAVKSSAYSLMGGLYDVAGQPQKAIQSYRQGIKADTGNALLHYGLGLAYFRNHQYAEAEQSAVSALRIDPKQAPGWRLYALVTFHQNKRAPALLGFCSYSWLQPDGPQSAEALGNLQHILQGGALKPEPGAPVNSRPDAINLALNQAITQAVALVAKRRYLIAADALTEQLQAVFYAVGKVAGQQHGRDAFFNHLAGRYSQLAQSGQVPAFARYVRQSTDKTAAGWMAAHSQQVDALKNWMEAGPQ